jgi:hypothetical protein
MIKKIKSIEKKFLSFIPEGISYEDIDKLLISDNNILRPLNGLSFEYLIEEIFIKKLKIKILPGVGDSDIDKYFFINNKKITLQIKTPVKGITITNKRIAVALHKTHGTEKKPKNLYPIIYPCPICKHDGGDFPDYLIIKHPDSGVMIVPKEEIKENKKYAGHFADPFFLDWNNKYLNNWSVFGFEEFNKINLLRKEVKDQIKFPQVSKIINLTDNEIIELFMQPENFRLFRMNLLGNLREPALHKFLKERKVKFQKPTESYPKYDVIINKYKVQIKGLSQHLCSEEKNVVGTEIMGTHGYGAVRRYSKTDFDYICIVIDPRYLKKIRISNNSYSFIFIKSNELPDHYKNAEWKTHNKIYENIKLNLIKEKNSIFFIPSDKYRVQVNFGFSKIELNKIPEEFISN